MQIYTDDQLVYSVYSNSIDTMLPLSAGAHSLVIKMWDKSGNPTSKSFAVTVVNSTAVTITSPTGSSTGSPVHILASATTGNISNAIGAMRVYVDDSSVYTVLSNQVDTYVGISNGSHHVVIVAWDQIGNTITKSTTLNVQ